MKSALSLLAVLALLLAAGADPLAAQAIRNNQGFQANVLPAGDDGPSSQATPLGFTINFFQKTFTNAFVNHNGNITFEGGFPDYDPEPINALSVPIIAPFWADVDTRGTGTITYGRDTVNNRPAFAVTWNAVGYFAAKTNRINTFQVVLIDRSDTGTGNFDIEMNYDRIQWEVGEASHDGGAGANGACLVGPPACIPASAGYSNGSRAAGTSFSIAGSLVPGAFLDNGGDPLNRRMFNSTIPGRLVFPARGGQVQQSTITSLNPSSRNANSGDFDLTINGSGFLTGAQVNFGGAILTPISVTASQIVVRIANSSIQTPGAIPVRVRQDGADSNAVNFTVASGGPTLSSLSPTSVVAGSADFDLTLSGSGFQQGAAVIFGGTLLTPASVTASTIVVRVTRNLIQTPEVIQVRVRQGTIDTPPLNFSVTTAPAPSISSLSPSSAFAGSPGFDLTLSGANFQQGATVLFGSTSLTPRSVSASTIVVAVPANLIGSAGTVGVRVRQGSIDSNTATFTVTATTAPVISSLSPTSRQVNSGDFQLTITGSNFIAGAQVRFGGDATLTPASITSTQIVVSVGNSLIQNTGDYYVTVVQNQVSSNPVAFTVTAAPIVIPPITLSGGGIVAPGGSSTATITLPNPTPVALSGTLTLNFTPNAAGLPSGYVDPALQFVSGGRTITFTIPSGGTSATLPNGGAFNAGTVAGTITLVMTTLEGAGASQLPSPAPSSTIPVARATPIITPGSVKIVNTSTGFDVEVQGFSTPRDLTTANFTFSASAAGRIEGSSGFSIPVSGPFDSWFNHAEGQQNGSRFHAVFSFTATGDANLIQSVSVTLTNSVGASAAVSGGR